MKDCTRARKQLVELIEEELAPFEREEMLEHISHCAKCTREYRELKKLYGLMKADTVSLPPAEIFDEMRRNVHPHGRLSGRRSKLPRFLAEVLVPVLGVAALLLIILWPRNGTVEFNVPVTELIEDEEIAGLIFARTVDNEMLKELIIIEGHLLPAYEEAIDELTPEEEEEFILALNRKFIPGT